MMYVLIVDTTTHVRYPRMERSNPLVFLRDPQTRFYHHNNDGVPPLTMFIISQFWGFFFSHLFDFLFHSFLKNV